MRMKRRLRKLQKDYAAGSVELEEAKASLAGYRGHLMHGDTYRLQTELYRSFVLKRERPEASANPTSEQS